MTAASRLIEPDSENTTVAQMLEGNHISYF
jgi:hypothetical protein